MDKREIVKRLLKEGIMVSPEDLARLDDENLEDFIRNRGFKTPGAGAGQTEDAETKKQAKPKAKEELEQPGLKITVARPEVKHKVGVQDFVSFYQDRFRSLREILAKRIDAVSINKTRNVFSSLSVIGMVKERTGKGYIIEDETGEMEVITDQDLDDDDIVGVSGMVREGKLFAGEVHYPDVPFNREIGKLKGRIFIGRAVPPGLEADGFFVTGTAEKAGAHVVAGLSNPSSIEISTGKDTVRMLYFKPAQGVQLHQAGAWLKKRFLPISLKEAAGCGVNPVLEPVPDIMWVDLTESGSSLHKGVLIVSSGAGGAVIDLETKGVEFV